MLREVGISLFLASVGLAAGGKFVKTVFTGQGLLWVGIGFAITVLPLLIIGFIGRKFAKLNYFTLIGLLAGSTTDPPFWHIQVPFQATINLLWLTPRFILSPCF